MTHGEMLYNIWIARWLDQHGVSTDEWSELDESEQECWEFLASNTDFEPSDEHLEKYGRPI